MSLDINAQGKMFCGVPNVRCRLRWEIWVEGKRACYQSWGPLAVLKFSEERKKFPDSAAVLIRMMTLDGSVEQTMLKATLGNVEKIEYHHLITKGVNVFAGLKVHTFTQGVWHCCSNGEVFPEVS